MTLKERRIDAGLSRRELAEKTGLGQRTIQAWEEGTLKLANAAYISIIRLAKALRCEPDDLFPDGVLQEGKSYEE